MKAHCALPFFLAILCLTPRVDSDACSPVMGYVRPTNYELVKEADAIVIAKAISFDKKRDLPRNKSSGIFRFQVVERIKGDFKEASISIEGDNDIRPWGDPNDFSFTKGDHGPCNPTDYKLKGIYVLFLQNWKETWLVGGPAFTRVNVLVEGTNAPWAKAVRQYARIVALNDYEKEKSALRELQSRALANDTDCPKALVPDIDAHFRKPTPAKSFSDLRMLYEQTDDSETRGYVLWACARGEKQDAKRLFVTLLRSGEWTRFLYPVCSFVARVELSGFHDVFAAALKTNRVENERRMLLIALEGSAQASEQTLMQTVLESVGEEEAAILGRWFVKHPSPLAIAHFTKLTAKNYFEHLQPTLALAGMGDTNVFNWAKQLVKRPAENNWLAYSVLAWSPLPAADTAAREVIQKGDSDPLVWLVQAYQDSPRSDRLDRVRDIVALKNKPRKLIFWLRRTLANWAHKGDKDAGRLLGQLPVVESE